MIWYTKSGMRFNLFIMGLSEKVYPSVVEYYYKKKSTYFIALDLKLETLQMFAY